MPKKDLQLKNQRIKEKDFQIFMEKLKEATRNIADYYFKVPIAERNEEKYRERVYCYELYHQLRLKLGNKFPYKLYGEIDKVNHSIIEGDKKPDFIVHKPGDMKYNLIVMEVKSIYVKNRIDKLEKDIETLEKFLRKPANYYRGILLIYGSDNKDLPKNIIGKIKCIDKRILVLWHKKPYEEAKIIKSLNGSSCNSS